MKTRNPTRLLCCVCILPLRTPVRTTRQSAFHEPDPGQPASPVRQHTQTAHFHRSPPPLIYTRLYQNPLPPARSQTHLHEIRSSVTAVCLAPASVRVRSADKFACVIPPVDAPSLPPAMTSAVASNLVPAAAAAAAPAVSTYGCRASFGRDAPEETAVVVSSASPVHPAVAAPAISKDFIDFEFSLGGGGCTTSMLPADELFADGKLLPLRQAAAATAAPEPEAAPPARLLEEAMPASPEPMKPIRGGAAAGAADQYVFSPKAPSCSSRWRELLGLKRAAAAQSPKSSPSPAAALPKTPGRTTTTSSSAARSLKFLLQRSNGGRASTGTASDLASAPLLRDSSDSEASLSLASSRFSHSSSSSSSGHDHDDVNPRFSLDSAADPNPPRLRLVRSSHRHSTSSRAAHSPARRRPSPPRQQDASRCLSVDSPRMNSSGKIVFQHQQGLERSCSSPCSLHAAARSRSMARAVDRSYSSGVRVAPVVLNVPVCSRPVFGFFKDKKESAASKDSSSSRSSSSRASTLGRKPTPPQRWSGELPKPCG